MEKPLREGVQGERETPDNCIIATSLEKQPGQENKDTYWLCLGKQGISERAEEESAEPQCFVWFLRCLLSTCRIVDWLFV